MLDDTALLHDDQLIGDVFHHGQIMADEDQCQVAFLLDVHDQIQNLVPNRGVQCRHGFITHQDLGFHGQCPGDDDALALTA